MAQSTYWTFERENQRRISVQTVLIGKLSMTMISKKMSVLTAFFVILYENNNMDRQIIVSHFLTSKTSDKPAKAHLNSDGAIPFKLFARFQENFSHQTFNF